MRIFTESLIFDRFVTAIPLATKLLMRLVNTSKYIKSNKAIIIMLLKLIIFLLSSFEFYYNFMVRPKHCRQKTF